MLCTLEEKLEKVVCVHQAGCASLADDTSIPKEKIKNYRNVAFLYINFDEKSRLNEKPCLILLFVRRIDCFCV